MERWFYFVLFFVGYLIGSIPFAVLISKAKGVDILKAGSGNPGATNVRRVLGKSSGVLVFVLDFLKGFFPATALKWYFAEQPHFANVCASVILLGCVIGHCFSIFLRFRGGRGVATAIGGVSALMPSVTIFSLITWFSVFKVTRFVSLASLCFALMLPLLTYLFAYPEELFWLSSALTILLFIRHLPNIHRLWNGTESRFGT